MPRERAPGKALKSSLVNSADDQVVNIGTSGGNAVRTVGSPWAEQLLILHRQVRSAVAKAKRAGTGSKNAKGDDVKLFDLTANDAAFAVLQKLRAPLVVDSDQA